VLPAQRRNPHVNGGNRRAGALQFHADLGILGGCLDAYVEHPEGPQNMADPLLVLDPAARLGYTEEVFA